MTTSRAIEIQQPARRNRWIGLVLLPFGLIIGWGSVSELIGLKQIQAAPAPLALAATSAAALLIGIQSLAFRRLVVIDVDSASVLETGHSPRSRWERRYRLLEFDRIERVDQAKGRQIARLAGPESVVNLNDPSLFVPPAFMDLSRQTPEEIETGSTANLATQVAAACGFPQEIAPIVGSGEATRG